MKACLSCGFGEQVSIEYGLAEVMNRVGIRNPRQPDSSEPWHLPFEKLYSILPSGVVDTSVQSILPKVSTRFSYPIGPDVFFSTFEWILFLFWPMLFSDSGDTESGSQLTGKSLHHQCGSCSEDIVLFVYKSLTMLMSLL
jgi:hypothetical protein